MLRHAIAVAVLPCALACGGAVAKMGAGTDRTPTVLTDAQRARDAEIGKQVALVVDAYLNFAPILLRDGRVVFTSTRDGIPALYVADPRAPSAPPRRLPGPN